MNIRIVKGAEADTLLADQTFLQEWRDLCARCPWATAFQSPDFAQAWYHSYRTRFEPLLVISRDSGAPLDGLLALAVSDSEHVLGPVGLQQAEYQSWITLPELAGDFPPAALGAVRDAHPAPRLRFRYLPPGTPTHWLRGAADRRRLLLRRQPRPLWRIGKAEDVYESMQKSGNKSRLRKLQRSGPIVLEHITSPERLREIMPTLIAWYDTRRLSMNGSAVFAHDPFKAPFHLAMMQYPGLVHATLFRAGSELLSAQIDVCTGNVTHLCILAHNPVWSRASPGKYHMNYLVLMLAQEGSTYLDLTPGADVYKERFANAWDQVQELTLHPGVLARHKAALRDTAWRVSKKTLRLIRLSPARARLHRERLSRLGFTGLAASAARAAGNWLASSRHTCIYTCQIKGSRPSDAPESVRHNAIEDLLAYIPDPGGPSRQEFAADALERFSFGQHLFTHVLAGRLLHYAWFLPRPTDPQRTELIADFELPPDAAVITALHTFAPGQGQGLAAQSLAAIRRQAQTISGLKQIVMALPANDSAAASEIEKAGFVCQQHLHERVRLGSRRRFSAPPPNQTRHQPFPPYLPQVHDA